MLFRSTNTNTGGLNDYYGKLILFYDHDTADSSGTGSTCTKASTPANATDDVCKYFAILDYIDEYESQGLAEVVTFSEALNNLGLLTNIGTSGAQSVSSHMGTKVPGLLIKHAPNMMEPVCTATCTDGPKIRIVEDGIVYVTTGYSI